MPVDKESCSFVEVAHICKQKEVRDIRRKSKNVEGEGGDWKATSFEFELLR